MEFTQGVRFDEMALQGEMMRALEKKNIIVSTPVQAGCIPPMREWKDVIAKAPTGTGKTFAFGIPIVEHIEPGSEETEAVILAPTRELAMQIDQALFGWSPKAILSEICVQFAFSAAAASGTASCVP